jgi:hypothetical protein
VTPTRDGRFDDGAGPKTLAELARPVWDAPEPAALQVRATGWQDRSFYGELLPLAPLGEGSLRLGPEGLTFADLVVPIDAIRSLSTERADTLQVATDRAMWQFRSRGSPFRLRRALERWRAARVSA